MRTSLLPLSVVCVALLAACGGDDGASTTTSTTIAEPVTEVVTTEPPVEVVTPETSTTVAMVTEGATVVVANGNIAGGSAGRMTDALGLAGFTTGTPINGSEKVDASIVYFTAAEGAEAVAQSVGVKLGGVSVLALPDPIPTETGTLDGGEVLVLLGNNEADKSLAELSGVAPADGTAAAAGSTIVVANASGIGGSAGRMSNTLQTGGYTVGEPTNSTESLTDSVIYFAADAEADAQALGLALGGVQVLAVPATVPTESGDFAGDILLLLGSAQADKTLAQLAG